MNDRFDAVMSKLHGIAAQASGLDFTEAEVQIPSMSSDLTNYRLEQAEKRADQADARMARIEDKLDRVLEKVNAQPTVGGLWTMVATVIGVSVGTLALMVAILTYLQAFPHH